MFGMNLFDLIFLVIIPIFLLWLNVDNILKRSSLGEVKVKVRRKKFNYEFVFGLVFMGWICFILLKKIQIDLSNNFTSYSGKIDFIYSYNPILLYWPLQMMFYSKLPYVMKEKGLSYNQFNYSWDKVKSYTWLKNNKLKIVVSNKIFFFKNITEIVWDVDENEEKEIRKIFDLYLENKEIKI